MPEKRNGQLTFDFGGKEEEPQGGILEPEDDSLLDFEAGDAGDEAASAESETDKDSSASWDGESFGDEDGVEDLNALEPSPSARIHDEAPEIPPPAAASAALSPHDMRRAALAWLAGLGPMALAAKVPTRLKRFRADAAGFWSEPGKKRLLKPSRTVVVEVRDDRETCWPECTRKEQLLPALREAKAKKAELEADIRAKEPHLKDSDVLFDDVPKWNYAKSSSRAYHRCLKQIDELERALYKGSRFERIRRAKVANELYLAVPEGAVHPDELADGWGLIYIGHDLKTTLVKPAEAWECPEENLLHLAQNIAASSMRDVLFANGVFIQPDGRIALLRPPRRRRPPTISLP